MFSDCRARAADARRTRQMYEGDERFHAERERIFARAWICAGPASEVKLPGQWRRVEVAGEPILVVRGPDLALRAFYDVCRHRGMPLVDAPCGRSASFRCAYHGWTYGLDGRGEHANLRPAAVAEWNGFVFVSLAPREPLAAFMGELPPWLVPPRPLVLGRRSTYVTNANWKLIVENFQESHHFPTVHETLERWTPTTEAGTWAGSGRWLGGTMTIRDAETISTDGSRHGRPLVGEPGRVLDAMLFPSLLTSLQPDYFLTYRLTPRSPATTEVTADVYFHPATERPGFDASDVYTFWDRVNAEDRAVCERQQTNVGSRAFEPRYLANEEGVVAFTRLVEEALA